MGSYFVPSILKALLLFSSIPTSSAQYAAPASPVANWSYTGCYTDAVQARSLVQASYASDTLTNAQCIQFCWGKGFYYAGTEYARECYCGTLIENGGKIAEDADCFMGCAGNLSDPCGGPNRLTLFNTTIPPGPIGPFVNPGANGYRSLGCYSDSVQNRSLAIGMSTEGGTQKLTVALCTSACAAGGYSYAGVEYAGECYCGNTIINMGAPAGASTCSMTCNGNSTEYCGGPDRLNLYTTRTAPDGWEKLGCYNDAVQARTLTNRVFPTGDLTTESCVAACQSAGYFYAGTENAGECYCGNSFKNGGGPASDGNTGCNMACNGNKQEMCGGPNRLNVYQFGDGPPASSTTMVVPSTSNSISTMDSAPSATTSTSDTPSTSITRTSSSMTSSSSSTSLVSTSSSSTDSTTTIVPSTTSSSFPSTTTASTSSKSISNSTTSSSLTYPISSDFANSTTVFTPTSASNSTSMIDLPTSTSSSTNAAPMSTSISSTASSPTSNLTTVAPPTTNTTQTGSSDTSTTLSTIPSYANTSKTSSQFSSPTGSQTTSTTSSQSINSTSSQTASSASSQIMNSTSFQKTSSTSSQTTSFSLTNSTQPTATQPSTTQPVSDTITMITTTTSATPTSSLTPGWAYQGCWFDNNNNGRAMSYQQTDNQNLTVESCVALCSNLGYSVAGMEYAYQCFCDNFLRNGATNASEADCSTACAGNSKQKCGAGNRLSVYSNNTALTVYPVPKVQKTGLPGSWQYQGCLADDAQLRALPYQIILTNNNSANACISQCSAFGYSAGGMEYGNECYCGDPSDVATAGVGPMPETDCSFGCSGNATTLCGGARRLSYYTWNGPTLNQWNYASGNAAGQYQFLIGGVVIPLVTQAGRNGKVTFLEKAGTGAPNTTGAYELDLAQINNFTGAWRPMHVLTDVFCSSSLTLPDKAGRQINLGGWSGDSTFGIRLYWPDGSPGVWGQNDWEENVNEVSLQAGRWYPTSMIMANGSILVVGGEQGSNGAPTPSLEILPPVGDVVFCDWLERTDPSNLYPFLAVLPSGGVFVAYYNEARILDEVTLQTSRVLPNMPGAVNNFLAGRTYPMEGTAVLLPQYAPYTDPLKVMICGGSTPYQGAALDNCVTLAPEVPNANWVLERMPSKRVLVCMTALPDGTYLILNGAQQGFGGFGLAQDPNHNAVLYDPSLPVNTRFTVMANTTIDRLYHSEAILLDDGRVLVTGSDPEDNRHEQEYRIEVFIPPYLMGNPLQPMISINNKDWTYGKSYVFTASQAIFKVSLLGAGASTHGNIMGQRTIFPAVSCSGATCTVTAPPNAHVCPPGWFQMFALNSNGVPSLAEWIRIGGDPAGIGNWPQADDFTLPGV